MALPILPTLLGGQPLGGFLLPIFNGYGTATITLSGSATGTLGFTGAGTATITLTGSGAGVQNFTASGTATITLTATGTGTYNPSQVPVVTAADATAPRLSTALRGITQIVPADAAAAVLRVAARVAPATIPNPAAAAAHISVPTTAAGTTAQLVAITAVSVDVVTHDVTFTFTPTSTVAGDTPIYAGGSDDGSHTPPYLFLNTSTLELDYVVQGLGNYAGPLGGALLAGTILSKG